MAAAAEHGRVLYAVPGSPVVAEHTVELLVADERVAVELVPALSFVDLAWVRLGIDPVERGVRLVDGHRFGVEAAGERGPLLVGQCDDPDVLSDIKLAIGDVLDATDAGGDGDVLDATDAGDASRRGDGEAPTVIVLQRLGLPDESVVELPWHELDRAIEPDHLTSVYVPALAAPVAGEVAAFAEVVRRLRADCPWDREQTHHSLRRHLLEEAYEVLEAIDHLDVEAGEGFDHLEEELGDLLFQVVFHSVLAAEEGRFTLADVARGVGAKLIGRHPHVFAGATAADADEVAAGWEQLKKAEKGRASVMDGIPDRPAGPALRLQGAEEGGVAGRRLAVAGGRRRRRERHRPAAARGGRLGRRGGRRRRDRAAHRGRARPRPVPGRGGGGSRRAPARGRLLTEDRPLQPAATRGGGRSCQRAAQDNRADEPARGHTHK